MYWNTIRSTIGALALLVTVANMAWAGQAEDQYAIAADHYSRSRWKNAVEEFRVFLERSPEHSKADDAQFFMAEALVQLGQFEQAHEALSDFLERAPNHRFARQALFRSGETSYLNQNYSQAESELKSFYERYPDDSLNAYTMLYLGEIELRRGKAAEAQQAFQKALRNFPNSPIIARCRFGLARSLEMQGDSLGAHRFYQLLADFPQGSLADRSQFQHGILYYNNQQYAEAITALRTFDTTFRKSKLRTDAGYWLGMAQLAQQRWSEAAQTFVSIAPEDPHHELAPAIAFSTAEAFRRAGKAVDALAHFERVYKHWPQSQWADDALKIRIDLALEDQQHEMVETLTAKFLDRYKKSPLRDEIQQTHGRSLLQREQYGQALSVFEKLVQEKSDESSNWYYLSLAYLGQKQYRKALQALDTMQGFEEQKELVHALLVARSAILIGLEDYAGAVAPLKKYLGLQPHGEDAPTCRARLAIALANSENFEEARLAHAELIRRHAGQPFVLQTTEYLAETAYAKGRRDWAQELFTELTRKGNPADLIARGRSGLAWLQFENNHPQQSAETFAQLLSDQPDSPLAAEAALMRAAALKKLKQFDASLVMYRLVIDKHSQSKQAPKAMFEAAGLYQLLRQDKEAALLYERLADEYPQLAYLDSVYYRWAWILVDLQRREDADKVFARIATDHPQSRYWGDAVYRLAQRAVHLKDYELARDFAERLIQSDASPEIVSHALYMKGQLAATEKKWSDVVQVMGELLDRFRESELRLPAEYWRAEAYYRQQDYSQASAAFGQLARKINGRGQAWLGIISLRQAQLLAQDKKWREAYEVAAGISEEFPDFKQQYEVDYLMGRCLSSQGEFDQARSSYEKVVRSTNGGSSETAAMAQWMIGEAYFHQKQYDEAIKAYHRVERLFAYPHWQAGALLQAGKCQEMKGQWNAAIEFYTQILKDYGDTSFSSEASRRLRVAKQRWAIVKAPN